MSKVFALISPNENDRFCEVSKIPFDVTYPLYWLEVSEGVSPTTHNFESGSFVPKPPAPVTEMKTSRTSGVEEM